MQRALASLVLAAALGFTRPAAAVEKAACVAAHADVQKMRRVGRIQAARRALATCLDAGCPSVVRVECASLGVGLEAAQPTLVMEIDDPSLLRAAVVDGEGVELAALARPLELDPGDHQIELTTSTGTTVRHRVFLREGEKGKVLAVTVAPRAPILAPPARSAPRAGSVPLGSWVFFGTGAASIAVGAVFGTLALTKGARLEERCGATRSCPESEVRTMERHAVIADVSLLLGLLSMAGGLAIFGLAPPPSAEAR